MVHAATSAAWGHQLPCEDCRAELARILDSADFDATSREHRFLSYVVEEALAGRGDRIKAYSIAVEVFGRDVSFDPQTDPIVRIEAGHLRRALERYYLTAGQCDPVLIAIPKGGYVPTFSPRLPPAATEAVLPAVPPSQPISRPSRWRSASWLTVIACGLCRGLGSSGDCHKSYQCRLDDARNTPPACAVV